MACILEVRVQPKSGRTAVSLEPSGRVKVWVTEPPERGKANDAVVEALARALGVPKSAVTVTRGHASRNKLVRVEGLTEQEAKARLGG